MSVLNWFFLGAGNEVSPLFHKNVNYSLGLGLKCTHYARDELGLFEEILCQN